MSTIMVWWKTARLIVHSRCYDFDPAIAESHCFIMQFSGDFVCGKSNEH